MDYEDLPADAPGGDCPEHGPHAGERCAAGAHAPPAARPAAAVAHAPAPPAPGASARS